MLKIATCSAAALLLSSPVYAQAVPAERSPLITALEACQRMTDGGARLACYDRASPALTGAVGRADVALVDRAQVRKVRRSMFGFSLPEFPFFKGRGEKEEPEPKEIVSQVRAFNWIGNGRFRVTIEDAGAVWESTEASSAIGDPSNGDKVTITSGAMGSYFLQLGSQRWVRARRVR